MYARIGDCRQSGGFGSGHLSRWEVGLTFRPLLMQVLRLGVTVYLVISKAWSGYQTARTGISEVGWQGYGFFFCHESLSQQQSVKKATTGIMQICCLERGIPVVAAPMVGEVAWQGGSFVCQLLGKMGSGVHEYAVSHEGNTIGNATSNGGEGRPNACPFFLCGLCPIYAGSS